MSQLRQDDSTNPNGAALLSLDRNHALILFGIATVAFTVILELIDPSHVSHGPTILNFEFAGSWSRAAQIMAEWGAKGRSAAHLSLVLDYALCRRRHKPYYSEFGIMPICLPNPALEAVIHRLKVGIIPRRSRANLSQQAAGWRGEQA